MPNKEKKVRKILEDKTMIYVSRASKEFLKKEAKKRKKTMFVTLEEILEEWGEKC